MWIPNRFRGLHRLHHSTHTPITIIMKLTVGNGDTVCCGRMGPPFRLGSRHDLVYSLEVGMSIG